MLDVTRDFCFKPLVICTACVLGRADQTLSQRLYLFILIFEINPEHSWSCPQNRDPGYKVNQSGILGVHISLCSECLTVLFPLSNFGCR